MLDVITCGELLIDFVSTESGVTLAEAPAFQKAAGGGPPNVAVGLARLGCKVGFMGKVGDEEFGHFLADTLRREGVDVGYLRFSTEARTTLAFVSVRADGERDFMFYRHPGADMLWREEEVDPAYVQGARVLLHGSISLIDEPSRSATLAAVRYARQGNTLVLFDPNIRLSLWPSAEEARRIILDVWPQADMVKLSEEELAFLAGTGEMAQAARRLWHDHLRLLVVTQGANGCTYFTPKEGGHLPGFRVQTVDATGAGDGFIAGMLAGLLAVDLQWEQRTLESALRQANAVGALTTTKRGAIPALPTKAQVEAFLREQGG